MSFWGKVPLAARRDSKRFSILQFEVEVTSIERVHLDTD